MKRATGVAEVLKAAVDRLLQPLVRILLANGMAFDEFAEVAKRAYVDVAMKEFGIPGRKQTTSRVSVLTGLTRKEVQRLLKGGGDSQNKEAERYHRAARVVGGWVRDRKFLTVGGEPRVLTLEGRSRSFSELVRRYSGDMPARAVLDELVRVGAVQRLEGGRVRLLTRAYVPSRSDVDKIGILGNDVADLVHTVGHNLDHGARAPRFQRKVMYDNLPAEVVEEFRKLSAVQAQQLLERMDSWLAKRDRDVTPSVKGAGRVRAGIGIYYFEENLQSGTEEKKT
jgi:Family of unknown function (DUF6502)